MRWLNGNNGDAWADSQKRNRWFVVLPAGLLAVMTITWLIGLVTFASSLPPMAPLPNAADGIVALTGGDTRLTEAMNLLSAKKGKRLLISGVNPAARRTDILSLLNTEEDLFNCCVDLDRMAVDTVGNARQTAQWIKNNNYHSLIIVTANYHMPRSLLEFHNAMPDIEIMPYPIQSDRVPTTQWWKNLKTTKFLASEYNKFLASFIRTRFF